MKNVIRLLLGSGAIIISMLSVSVVYAGDYGSSYGGGYHDGYARKSYDVDKATQNQSDEADDDVNDEADVTGDIDDADDSEEIVVQKHKSQKEDPTNLRAN